MSDNDEISSNAVNITYEYICTGRHVDDDTQPQREDQSHGISENMEVDESRKRIRDNDSPEHWSIVDNTRRSKSPKIMTDQDIEYGDRIDVSVYHKERFPRQFALAKLFKENHISGIQRVKYVNPFKLLITFARESNANKLITCTTFIDKGWKYSKTMEVGVSYGVIKDVELDLPIEKFLEYLTCDKEILSAVRLNRRNKDSDTTSSTTENNANVWTVSESIRLCFKGASLPHTYTYMTCELKLISISFQ